MKKTRTCPKCGSNDIVCIPGSLGSHGTGNAIPVGLTVFGAVKVSRYLCGSCGYTEEWIVDKKDLRKLKAKYGR